MEDKNEQKVLKIESMLRHIMTNILNIPMDNSTEGTPKRIAKMWVNETLVNRNDNNMKELNAKMKVFDNVDELTDLIIVKDIPFYSTCEHHFMPFFGKITVGYVPSSKIIGLSKIPRVVEYFSKKPQLQERLVKEIGEYLVNIIHPVTLFVVARDTMHTCVLCRGIESECDTDTMFRYECGVFESDYKQEFFERIRR